MALPVLQQVFDSHFAHTSAHDLTSLAGLLEQNCRLSQVKALLQSILNTPAQLATIAKRSYWHGNGFLKIVLLDQGYKLRLHIWCNGVVCEENIHSHRWGFASHVLQGALRSEIWQDGTDNQEQPTIMADEYRYTAKQGDTPAQKAFYTEPRWSNRKTWFSMQVIRMSCIRMSYIKSITLGTIWSPP